MTMYELMLKCVTIPYERAGKAANYAFRRDGGVLYIFFQHSDGPEDWKNNLDFAAKPYKRTGKRNRFAHRGFLRVWKELEGIMADRIADDSIDKIVISGYSHGAALALLCYEYALLGRPDLRDKNAIEGYGFGCPRVFRGIKHPGITRHFEGFTVVRNINDIVTHLPPFVFGYFHVGRLLEIGKKGRYSPVDAHRAENILRELLIYEKGRERISADTF